MRGSDAGVQLPVTAWQAGLFSGNNPERAGPPIGCTTGFGFFMLENQRGRRTLVSGWDPLRRPTAKPAWQGKRWARDPGPEANGRSALSASDERKEGAEQVEVPALVLARAGAISRFAPWRSPLGNGAAAATEGSLSSPRLLP